MKKREYPVFLDKRGSLITRQMIVHLGMISILAIVFLLLKGFVDSVQANSEFEMSFLARDLALLTNTLYSAPGDVEYDYALGEIPLRDFSFEFGKTETYDDKREIIVVWGNQKKSYPYAGIHDDTARHIIKQQDSIKFFKKDNKLEAK